MFRAERSPLYRQDVVEEERRSIQNHNCGVIKSTIHQYTLEPGEERLSLKGLSINGKKSDEATLTIQYKKPHSLLAYIEHPDHKGMLCRREVCAEKDSKIDWSLDEVPFWLIDQSILETTAGFEGNGFGTGLLVATESLVPAWINDLEYPPYQVIARHLDNARGAEQLASDNEGYRAGWTSNMLGKLGYRQATLSSLEYNFGKERTKNLGTPEKNWTKILR